MEFLIEFLMFMGDRFNKCRLKTGGRDKSEWCGKGYKSAGDWVEIGWILGDRSSYKRNGH